MEIPSGAWKFPGAAGSLVRQSTHIHGELGHIFPAAVVLGPAEFSVGVEKSLYHVVVFDLEGISFRLEMSSQDAAELFGSRLGILPARAVGRDGALEPQQLESRP